MKLIHLYIRYARHASTDWVRMIDYWLIGAEQMVALQAAREGMTLLKNVNKTLPFNRFAIKSIALIGPNADDAETMQGTIQ
jgi:beta-glucosidase-like glycosyl hydrolase